MLTAIVVLVVIGSFVLGSLVSWVVKDHVEEFISNAAYAKAITHPEMLDENGNILHDELLFLHTHLEDDEDDDE